MKYALSLLVVLCLVSCTTVSVMPHPDYYYPATNPASVMIYDQFIPTYEFVIIGRLNIDATWSLGGREMVQKIQAKAATIGGDGVIVTNSRVDVYAFNRGVKTEGTATAWGNQVRYSETTRDNTIYMPVVTIYAYVIKRLEPGSSSAASAQGYAGVEAKAEVGLGK